MNYFSQVFGWSSLSSGWQSCYAPLQDKRVLTYISGVKTKSYDVSIGLVNALMGHTKIRIIAVAVISTYLPTYQALAGAVGAHLLASAHRDLYVAQQGVQHFGHHRGVGVRRTGHLQVFGKFNFKRHLWSHGPRQLMNIL